MSNSDLAIRNKLYDFIRVADEKRVNAIYNLLENEIEETNEWWKDKGFVKEINHRHQLLESRTDKGFSLEELVASVDKLRLKKYGKSAHL
jgi:hypothetical protein